MNSLAPALATVVRWGAFLVVVWLCLQTVPAMVDQIIDWRREDACFDRHMNWQEQGFGSGNYKCVEETNGSTD